MHTVCENVVFPLYNNPLDKMSLSLLVTQEVTPKAMFGRAKESVARSNHARTSLFEAVD